MDAVTKVLLGKGQMQSIKPIRTTGWQGVQPYALSVPWDAKQAAHNVATLELLREFRNE